jgi:hypothetical protein
MADLTQDPSAPAREFSPAIMRLAERYGMTPQAIEQIIAGSPANGIEQGFPTVAGAPATDAALSGAISEPLSASPGVAAKAVERPRPTGLGLPLAMVLILLIGVGLTLSVKQGCFQRRDSGPTNLSAARDTLQAQQTDSAKQASEPPIEPSSVAPPQVPPESLVTPRESPAGTTGPTSNAGATNMAQAKKESAHRVTRSVRKPTLTTSSPLEAEERLAELRAAGNSRARIVRNGDEENPSYRVYTR